MNKGDVPPWVNVIEQSDYAAYGYTLKMSIVFSYDLSYNRINKY